MSEQVKKKKKEKKKNRALVFHWQDNLASLHIDF